MLQLIQRTSCFPKKQWQAHSTRQRTWSASIFRCCHCCSLCPRCSWALVSLHWSRLLLHSGSCLLDHQAVRSVVVLENWCWRHSMEGINVTVLRQGSRDMVRSELSWTLNRCLYTRFVWRSLGTGSLDSTMSGYLDYLSVSSWRFHGQLMITCHLRSYASPCYSCCLHLLS